MYKFRIKLNQINDIRDFVKVSHMYNFPVKIYRNDKFLCCGESILGMFSADLSMPVDVMVSTDDKSNLESFKKI